MLAVIHMIQAKLFDFTLPYPEKGDRRVRVYVPAHEEGEALPVIYMTDGQNLFNEETGTWGCWFTREAVEAERQSSGKAAIIVGVHNDNPWRDNELTPAGIGDNICAHLMEGYTASEGEIFDSFMLHIVKPYVEQHFPVKTGRENTAVCGSSSGGLQAFFTALSHPEVFGAAGVFSPAFLLYSEEDMRRWIISRLTAAELPYLFLYTGAGDDLEMRIYQSTEAVYDMLMACYPMHLLNEIVLFENPHHEKAWAEVFPDFIHTFLN